MSSSEENSAHDMPMLEGQERPFSLKAAVILLGLMALAFVGLAGYTIYDGVVHQTGSLMPAIGVMLVYGMLAVFYGSTSKGLLEGNNVISRGVFGALVLAPVGYFMREAMHLNLALLVWLLMVLMLVALLSPATRDAVGFHQRGAEYEGE